ncbi:MAG: hypothetical protein JSS35_19450 [Proteobacteria bacterium]|nr:hypothetical protein [Pseudomonadota bacterium]
MGGLTPYFSWPRLKSFQAQDGLYVADDLDVQRLLLHKKVACTNGRH